MSAYPDPSEEGWEDKYRFARAKDDVYSGMMKRIQAWADEAAEIENNEVSPPKTIV